MTTPVQSMDAEYQVALGEKTGTTSWDNGDELDITAEGTIAPSHLHVYTAQDIHLICDRIDTDPETDPAVYVAGETHIIDALNMTYLHFKNLTTGGKIFVTALGKAI